MQPNTRQWFESLPPQHQKLVAQVMLHEAQNQGPRGMAAIADVVRNRQLGSGKGVPALLDPVQFTGFEEDGQNWTPEQLAQAREAVGLDTGVGGATHYYNPSIANPYWGKHMRNTANVGDHYFGDLGTPDLDPFLPRGRPALMQTASYQPMRMSAPQSDPVPSMTPMAFSGAPATPIPVGGQMSPLPLGWGQQMSPVPEGWGAPQIMSPLPQGGPQPHLAPAPPPVQTAPPLAGNAPGLLGNTPFNFMDAILRGFGKLV